MSTAYKQTDILLVGGDDASIGEINSILTDADPNYSIEQAIGLDSATGSLENEKTNKPNVVIIGPEFGTTSSKSLISKIRAESKFAKIKIFKISKDNETVLAYAGLDVDLVSKPDGKDEYKAMLTHKISQLRRL